MITTKSKKSGKNYRKHIAIFFCDYCKKEVEKRFDHGNNSRSCGCVKWKFTSASLSSHGLSHTKLYAIWNRIKQCCTNPKYKDFELYGKRGIRVCHEWLSDVKTFIKWAKKNGYKEGLQINRINNDGNYDPNNCNFITPAQNARNRRNNILDEEIVVQLRAFYEDKKCTYQEVANAFNVSKSTVYGVLNYNIW